jgi:hypothetical protein
MDDQVIGVSSYTEGLKTLSEVGRSLARLHLTPNSKKSRILRLSEARRHFHLDLNKLLDEAEDTWKQPGTILSLRRRAVARRTRQIWYRARLVEGEGEFQKILARLYRLAGTARARFLRYRARRDLLSMPELASRICDYMRVSSTPSEYLQFVLGLLQSDEQIYPDVTIAIFESLLRVEARGRNAERIRWLAAEALRKRLNVPGELECAIVAPLLILRFGDRRSIPLLKGVLERDAHRLDGQVARALGLAISSYGAAEFRYVRRLASRLLRNHLASAVLMVERIIEYPEVPHRYSGRLTARFDSVAAKPYLDMRSLLTVRLLALNKRRRVNDWIRDWRDAMLKQKLNRSDKSMLVMKIDL